MSLDVLKDLFSTACTQQQEIARAACVRLGLLSSQSGFYPAVTRIAVDRAIDPGARLQSILYLKNAVDGVWRSNKSKAPGSSISDEEKQAIRQLLLAAYNDPNNQISLHIAVVISKIARFDCPQYWPELIPELASAIDGSVARADTISHQRALFILYHVVKTLASKRLAVDKRIFHELCSTVFNPIYGYWRAHLSQANVNVVSSSSAVLCLKTLRYMVVYGFTDPVSNQAVSEFLRSLNGDIQTIVGLLATSVDDAVKEHLQKIVLASLKLIIEFQEHGPLDFVHWMAPYLDLANFCAFGMYSTALPTLAQVRAINILKLVLLCQDYRTASKGTSDLTEKVATLQAIDVCAAFFTTERTRILCQALIERYLILTPEELEIWHSDPEAYATTENTEAWRHMIRPASESFFMALVHECWQYIAPYMASQYAEIVRTPIDFQNAPAVLARDAVLTAIGLAASDLYEEVDFDNLFTNICLPLMTTVPATEMERIIVRRIIWLCGKWIDVKFSKELRPRFYEAVIRVVGRENEDMVLRLTACDALKHALDEYEFELESFLPCLNDAVSALILLLRSCVESDSQMQVVTTLWLLAERSGRELAGKIDAIVAYVPTLWQSENFMLKGQILNLFTQLVKGLGSDCYILMDGLSIMLSTALDTDDAAHVYLLEDGLDLWLSLVENSKSPLVAQLLSLFRFMPRLLTVQSENLRVCCDIVKAYCLYGDPEFAKIYLPELGQVFRTILPEMRSEGVVAVIKVVEMVIRCFRQDSLAPMSGIIIWCIETLVTSQDSTIGVRLICASIIALVSIQNAAQLYEVIASAMTEEQILAFLKKWLELVGLITHDLERRKSSGLGLCAWLMLPVRIMDSIFPDVISTLVDVLFDVCIDENGSYVDSLITYDFGLCGGAEDNAGFPETEHDKRNQRLRDFDPIYSTSLQSHVVNALNAKKQFLGEDTFAILWNSVNAEIAQNLQKLCAL